jgi:rsbT co-antagonist protein RsbR
MSSDNGTPPLTHEDVSALLQRIAHLEERLAASEASRMAEGAQRENEATISALVHAIPDLILRVNKAGIVLYFKPSKKAAPGMPEGNFVGKDVREVLPAWAAKNLQHMEHVIESGELLTTAYSFSVGNEIRHHECRLGTGGDGEVVSFVRDVTARRRADGERQRIQEILIHTQAAALVELSTPIIPIHDRVFVVPLIGTIDAERANSIISTLLEGVTQQNALVAILDITGVSVVDSQVADALPRAAQATKLVGARLVLTGMRPEVARTLVELGADLTGVITRGTLQRGIAYAMGELGMPKGRPVVAA